MSSWGKKGKYHRTTSKLNYCLQVSIALLVRLNIIKACYISKFKDAYLLDKDNKKGEEKKKTRLRQKWYVGNVISTQL